MECISNNMHGKLERVILLPGFSATPDLYRDIFGLCTTALGIKME
jgi:hypothetical protein